MPPLPSLLLLPPLTMFLCRGEIAKSKLAAVIASPAVVAATDAAADDVSVSADVLPLRDSTSPAVVAAADAAADDVSVSADVLPLRDSSTAAVDVVDVAAPLLLADGPIVALLLPLGSLPLAGASPRKSPRRSCLGERRRARYLRRGRGGRYFLSKNIIRRGEQV